MEEQRLVPKRRFSGYTKRWYSQKLEDIFNDIGNAFVGTATPYYVEQGHLYLQSNNVKNGKINMNEQVFINDEFYLKQKNKWLQTGDIVMVQSGHVGETAIIDETLNNSAAHALIMLRNYKIKTEPLFVNNQFQTMELIKKLKYITTGNTIKHILASDIKKFSLNFTDYEEQQKIGEFFQVLDERIINQERKIAKVKTLKSAYLIEMFPQESETVPKRRFKGFEGKWEEKRLKEIGRRFTGLSGKTKKDFGHGTAEFVTYVNVFNNAISDKKGTDKVVYDDKQTQLKYGDVLFTTSSETPDEVGMSSVWLYDKSNVYLNSFCFGFRSNINLDYYFIAFMLRANKFRKHMEILAQGISRYNISKTKVMEIEIQLPSIEEQQKIGQFFKNLDDQIATEEFKLEKLKKMKEAYLEEMFV